MGLLVSVVIHALASTACLVAPVKAPIVDPFRRPPCEWCPGNRGIEFGPTRGQRVLAAAAGTVTFSGTVVHTIYVVVAHADGTRTTYGNLVSAAVHRGEHVDLGDEIGIAGETTHFGWRDASGRYLDPTPVLGSLRVRPYLVPTDGTAPRVASHGEVCERDDHVRARTGSS
jgi:murein DD-endopeptidase MepM/ murein hydrolase activator NlpD